MPVLQFKGKIAIECYHHTVSHHTLEFDSKLSVLGKGEKQGLDGNLIIEGGKLIALCKRFLPPFPMERIAPFVGSLRAGIC